MFLLYRIRRELALTEPKIRDFSDLGHKYCGMEITTYRMPGNTQNNTGRTRVLEGRVLSGTHPYTHISATL